jgi:acetylornithine deacetylase/succinyl-diaminopimelate desuccinylase-like protein
MLCDHCVVAGYLELLPADEIHDWQGRFRSALSHVLTAGGWNGADVTVTFPETYPGHYTPSDKSLCQMAEAAVEDALVIADTNAPRWSGWSAFNSGCEAGLRANLLGTPTLVWGPGSLAQAHAVDEFVPFDEVRAVAGMFVRFARAWSAGDDGPA